MRIKIIIAAVSLALVGSATAGTTTISEKTNATLSAVCSITANDISFGDVTPQSTSDAGWTTSNPLTFSLNVLCINKQSYQLALNAGAHASGNNNYLLGANSGDKIPYILCKKSGLSSAGVCTYGQWAPSQYHSDTGTGSIQVVNSAAYIKKSFSSPDSYSDRVTATISF